MKNLDLLLPQQSTKTADSWVWATVTQADPLRIRLDGDETALPITPECVFYGIAVGMRVWVQLSGHRVIVLGPHGGVPFPEPPPPPPTPRLNVISRHWLQEAHPGGSWANGTVTTIALWEPGPTWPADASAAQISFSVHGRADNNAAAFYELLGHDGSGWFRIGYQRVHNNAIPSTSLGAAMTVMLDREETTLGDCRLAANIFTDPGGGWISTGPSNFQISFLKLS